MFGLTSLLFACAQQEPAPLPEETAEVVAPLELPTLEVTEPARRAFVGNGPVEIAGIATPFESPLHEVTAGDQVLELDPDGRFSGLLEVEPGINIVGLRVDDEAGERAVDGRAFFAGPTWPMGSELEDAATIHLSPELLDDGDDDLDDLAVVMAMAIKPELGQGIVGTELEGSAYTATITDVTWKDVDVDLVTDPGLLRARIELVDLTVGFDIVGNGWLSWLGTSGKLESSVVELDLDLQADGLHVEVTSTSVALVGYDLDVDSFPDSLEGELVNMTREMVEDSVALNLASTTGSLIDGLLQSFVVEANVGQAFFQLALGAIAIEDDGLHLSVDAQSWGVPVGDIPEGAGSLRTDLPVRDAEVAPDATVAVAVDDDLVNQLLFACWYTGTLDTTIALEDLPASDALDLEAPLGPAKKVSARFGLPPVVRPPSNEAKEMGDLDAEFQLGELVLTFEREDGETFEFSVNLLAGIDLVWTDGVLSFVLDSRPANVDVQVGVFDGAPNLDPGDLAALVRLMVPPLMSNADELVPTVPLPVLDVGSFLGSASALVEVEDPLLVVDENGWVHLSGHFAEAH